MSYYQPSGQHNAAEYQASGLPFVTQSATNASPTTVSTIEFPFVTKFFFIRNVGANPLNVGFTRNGVLGTNKFTLLTSQSFQGDIRVKDLFVCSTGGSTNVEVVAGLTGIARKNFPVLTGSLNVYSGSAQEELGFNGFGYPGI